MEPTAPEMTAVSYPKSNPPRVATSVKPITKDLFPAPLFVSIVIIKVLKSRGEYKDYTEKSLAQISNNRSKGSSSSFLINWRLLKIFLYPFI
jgi:hypothetical protein